MSDRSERSRLPSLWERDRGEGWLAGAHAPLRRLLPPAMPKGGRENARLSTSYGAAPFSPREKGTRTRLALSLSGRASLEIVVRARRRARRTAAGSAASVFRSSCMTSQHLEREAAPRRGGPRRVRANDARRPPDSRRFRRPRATPRMCANSSSQRKRNASRVNGGGPSRPSRAKRLSSRSKPMTQ